MTVVYRQHMLLLQNDLVSRMQVVQASLFYADRWRLFFLLSVSQIVGQGFA